MSEQKKVTIHIKSLPYAGRYGSEYRANTIVSVDEDEALQLVEAGLADFHEKDRAVFVESKAEPMTPEQMASAILENIQAETISLSDEEIEELEEEIAEKDEE